MRIARAFILCGLSTCAGCHADTGGAGATPPGPDLVMPTSSEDLASLADASEPTDSAVAPDLVSGPCPQTAPLPNATCADVTQLITAWISCTSACESTGQCVVATVPVPPCRNECSRVVGTQTAGRYLDSLYNAAVALPGCLRLGCACILPGSPVCSNGTCSSSFGP